MSLHDDRLASLLVHLAADYIAREAGRETLITPTRAAIGRDRNATVFVTVFPESHAPHALEFLSRHSDEFRTYMKKEARFSHLPRVTFLIDEGEAQRRHLDDLSRGL
jgi:ribosome-binding factor A